MNAPVTAEALEQALAEASLPGRARPPRDLLVAADADTQLRNAVVEWAWILVFWAGMALTPGWLWPLWALAVASRIHALGVILHEVCHMPLRHKGPKVRLLELLAGYPLASTLEAMRYHHLRHHRDSCMATDPYAKPDLRGRPGLLFLYWLRTLLILPAWVVRGFVGSVARFVPPLRAPYARALLQDRSGRRDLADDVEVIAAARAEIPQACVHAGVIALAVVAPGPVVLGYVLPGLVASLLCGWRLLQEHSYQRVDDRRLESILTSTRDHNTDLPGRLLFAPRNIGYHVVHHLHPQVAKEALPALASWYKATYPTHYPPQRPFWPWQGARAV
ncbi:MAG: fatty acid desaturase [Alphaproteobacteria bacterium]|nr:fatty acid desaturase [Alphaproteobacteria bacterium]